jgi:peptide/nickel transport system substrate-binding protein
MSSGPELPSGTVTFLFTDIEGSTRLVKALGDRYEQVLAEHQGILRAAFAAHHGHEVDTQGDSFFVAFRRARDAVNCAVDAQHALPAHDWPEGVAVKVRMGIHTGEPVVGEQRYTGIGVHRAARIGAVGNGGQILLSNATRELIEDDLPQGVTIRDLGRRRLKDIQRPERIYQVTAEGLPWKFPPLKTAGAANRLRSRRTALAVGALVVAGVAAGVLLTTLGSSETAHASTVAPNSVGIVDPEHGTISSQVTVGSAPSGVAGGEDAVWVANTDANTVSRIDPSTGSVRQDVDVGGGPSGVTVGGGAVWVANGLDGTVSRIDPGSNRVVKTTPVGAGPSAITYGAGAVWVANSIDGTLSRIDPQTWKVTKTIPAARDATAVAIGFGRIWVASQSAGAVVVIDPKTGDIEDTIGVGVDPDAVAIGEGVVWVANRADGTVSRIDPNSRTVTKTIGVGRTPEAIAAAPGAVWVANAGDGSLSRIDPAAQAVAGTVTLGNPPRGLTVAPSGLYVAVRATGRAHRGGTLRIATPFAPETLDPALSYSPGGWAVLMSTNDGLVGFRRVGGAQGTQLVPDLAESLPTPTDNGTTYTFVIRRGLRYSNGPPVQPADVRRTLERLFSLHSPGAGYYGAIVGADRCMEKPSACDLSKGIVTDAASRTVTFHLARPDGELPVKLALPFAFVVPSNTPFREEGAKGLPATGPYRVAHYVKNKVTTIVRNPGFHEWSADAQPQGYPDVITLRSARQAKDRVRTVDAGSVDVAAELSSTLSKDELDDIAARSPGRMRVTTRPETDYVFLNTRVPPFDDVRVRRAFDMAVDRDELIRRIGGYAYSATCQVIPPNFPGYRPRPCATDGLEAARELVAASPRRGQRVVVWTPAPFVASARYAASVLEELGFRATVKQIAAPPQVYFDTVGDSRRRIQAGISGWAADYPSPGGFLRPLFTCAGFVPGKPRENTNWSEFCDRNVDRQLDEAVALQGENPAAATLASQAAERSILALAPIVPLNNSRNVDLVSKRLGDYQYNPQFGFLLDQAWVK